MALLSARLASTVARQLPKNVPKVPENISSLESSLDKAKKTGRTCLGTNVTAKEKPAVPAPVMSPSCSFYPPEL